MITSCSKDRLCLLVVLLIAPFPGMANGQTASTCAPPPDYARKAAEYMQARARVTGFSGAVTVACDGRPILRAAFGLANHELAIANTPPTKFRIGSVTKQFTAAAILLLEQRGRLSVTDPVSKHVPDWPTAWDRITIHHLLSHAGGLPRITTQALLDVSALTRATPTPFRGVRDLLKPGEELQPLDFTPGERFAYSNVGYIVLAMIVENVSGQPYCAFLEQDLFRPLDMRDTGCENPDEILKGRASGYTRVDGRLANAGYVDVRFVSGAGAVYSTVDDLLLWNRALDSDRLLSAAARERLFTPGAADYAYGWWVQTRFNRRVQWHGGSVSGFVAHIARFPDRRLFITVLSNVWSGADRGQVRAIANELAAMALGEKYDVPRERQRAILDAAGYDAYVGTYGGRDTFAIVRDGVRLLMQIPPGVSVFELFPESPLRFFASRPEYYLTFIKDAGGVVTAVVIRNEGEEATWVKSR